jgi:hypothetical protein
MGTNDPEAHHAAPRCLISLHEKANGTSLDGEGIQAWLEWEWEAMRWRVPVEISRDELEALVERSTVVLEREKHRLIHEGDFEALWSSLVRAARPQEMGPDRTGGSRSGEGDPVKHVTQGGLEVTGPNVASKPPRIGLKARSGR